MNIRLFPPTLQPWNGGGSDREIVVLMSGGVDSSVTAMLLKEAGWDVLGVTMKIPADQNRERRGSCCGMGAAYVCRDLDIPHYYIDVHDAFRELVIERFRREYFEGRTPSPCVDCNTLLKFRLVWDYLEMTFGISRLATGHYARVRQRDGQSYLSAADDEKKDQSYFLYGIPGSRLPQLVLPLGELTKARVRSLAKEHGLPSARRPEGMELCFAGEGDYRGALGSEPKTIGPILNGEGDVIGQHEGIANYTVGQRRGIGVAAPRPFYVTCVNAADNCITVGTFEETQCEDVSARDMNVLVPEKLRSSTRLYGKIRSQGQASACTLLHTSNSSMRVRFDTPQFAPSPGQHLVLYDEHDNVVAGGTICAASQDRREEMK